MIRVRLPGEVEKSRPAGVFIEPSGSHDDTARNLEPLKFPQQGRQIVLRTALLPELVKLFVFIEMQMRVYDLHNKASPAYLYNIYRIPWNFQKRKPQIF